MAKWKSPIFSDIRNKLGENVVFSMWKGRQYMRSYTKPANPKTLAQTANRLHMEMLVSYWQSAIATTPSAVTEWNKAGLSDLISGFNRFIKGARGFVLGAVSLDHTSFSMVVESCKIPANDALVVVYTAASTLKESFSFGPRTYTSADFSAWTPAASDTIYLVDKAALGSTVLSTANIHLYGCQIQKVDEATGTLVSMVLT